MRVIGPLCAPDRHGANPLDAFHVVAPSLPGFGYSVPFSEPGWGNPFRVATALAELMDRLGYARFGVHGASVGACVAATSGVLSTDRVIGVHLGAPALFPYGNCRELDHDTTAATFASSVLDRFLADSPTALLAWIVEHFVREADTTPHAGVELDRDQLLTNASLYWFTGTAATSTAFVLGARRTYDTFVATAPDRDDTSSVRLMLPWARASRIPALPPWTEFDGGRSPAMAVPELLVADLRAFFRTYRGR
jgi:epoxide hydrolase